MKTNPIHYTFAAFILTSATSQAGFRNFQTADLVLGQTASGTASLKSPNAVAVDPVSKKVFVCDTGNHRVLRYASADSLTAGSVAEAVFGQANFKNNGSPPGAGGMTRPSDVAVDDAGHLWVADKGRSRVLRFDNAAAKSSGTAADGVLGQPDFDSSTEATTSSGMVQPHGLAISGTTLFVSDAFSHRVLRFDNAAAQANGAAAQAVFGQFNFTSSASGLSSQKLSSPSGLAVEQQAGQLTLWVADQGNNRVLAFPNAGNATVNPPASRVIGQSTFITNVSGLNASALSAPAGVAFQAGALYVSDSYNHRVLRWHTPYAGSNGSPANGVLGQADFTSNLVSPNRPQFPQRLTMDPAGALWLTVPNNAKDEQPAAPGTVLRYQAALTKPPGALPDLILTEPETDSIGNIFARGIAISPNSGKVFVTDNNRVLRFASIANLQTGSPPEAVLGQTGFTTFSVGSGASQMNLPAGLVCSVNDELWVADEYNHRVLRFTNASTAANGAAASNVLGQSAFGVSGSGTTLTNMKKPEGLALDGNGTLWVADSGNSRVLRFDLATFKSNGAAANGLLGQANYFSGTAGLSDKAMNTPTALALGGGGRLWVLDAGNHRVLRFENAASKSNYSAASGVLGQPDFTTGTPGKAAHQMNTTFDGIASGGLAVDGVGRLYVLESENCRVTWFNAAATRPNGAAANGLLGQPNFGAREVIDDPRHFSYGSGLAMDTTGALWVAENGNFRVMRFSNSLPAVAACGLDKSKHFYMNLLTQAGSSYQIERSPDLKTWSNYGAPFTTAYDFYAWGNPQATGTRHFFRVREVAP